MDERIDSLADLARWATYHSEATLRYIDGAPHIKHLALRRLYSRLAIEVYDFAAVNCGTPSVLDLGAGEGSVTLPFLALGAAVTAVDASESRLDALRARCMGHAKMLEVRCEDVFDAVNAIQQQGKTYDIIVANSFLHHIPDYVGLIRRASAVLSVHGQFFSFQDPLRYDSVGKFTTTFGTLAYLSWRIFKGDVVGGLRRRIGRSRGVYHSECVDHNAEFHALRGGVDQDAISRVLGELGFECRVVPYFSTQSRAFQAVGTSLGLKNSFAVIARRYLELCVRSPGDLG